MAGTFANTQTLLWDTYACGRSRARGSRPDVNQTFLQPFLAYNTKMAFGVTLQTKSSYNWEAHQWTVLLGVFASQILRLGGSRSACSSARASTSTAPAAGRSGACASTWCCSFPSSDTDGCDTVSACVSSSRPVGVAA